MITKGVYIRLLRSIENVEELRRVHRSILESACCRDDRYLGNLLVLLYGRCSSLDEARWVFDHGIPQKNVYSWNVMLQAFAQNGHFQDAIATYERMPSRDAVSSTTALGVHTHQGHVEQAWSLFEEMNGKTSVCWNAMLVALAKWRHSDAATALLLKMPETSLLAWTLVIQANATAGYMDLAKSMFDTVPEKDVALFTSVVQGYAQNGQLLQSKWLFDRMPQHNAIACSTISQAYFESGHVEEAKAAFDSIRWEKSIFSWTTLLQTYGLNDHFDDAVRVFYLLPRHDVVSCTTMVGAAILNGRDGKYFFDRMPWRNHICWNALLSAYAHAEHLSAAESVLDRLPQTSAASWTAMISAYGSAGHIKEADHLFHSVMPERSFHTWNVMLQTYSSRKECLERAKEMFSKMPQRDIVSWNSMAVVIAQNASLEDAMSTFASMPEKDVYSWNALLAAHSRAGVPLQAIRKFFDEGIGWKNKHSWNIMLAAYAQNGEAAAAMVLTHEMVLEGVRPDEVTLSALLTCCSYIGLVDTGQCYFVWITAEFGLKPRAEEYTSMLNLLTRAGRLEDAHDLLLSMPYVPDGFSWTTLLAASMENGDMQRASQAATSAMEMDRSDGAPYVLLSNVQRGLRH